MLQPNGHEAKETGTLVFPKPKLVYRISQIIEQRARSTSPTNEPSLYTFLIYSPASLTRDEFSSCFESKPIPPPGNLILYCFYLWGSVIRYTFLFPLRLSLILFASSLFFPFIVIHYFTFGHSFTSQYATRIYFKIWQIAIGVYIRHHGKKPAIGKKPHLFVSNHTTFIDFLLLSSHGAPHTAVAQIHGGLFGILQKYILSINGSLFFDRKEKNDRLKMAIRMKEHLNSPLNSTFPLLVFPEGTCVNNESIMLFHKGAFELDAIVCPVAIKYNKTFSDPYWNSREQSFTQHLIYYMTRWFTLADVYWLPALHRLPHESSIHFADRTKDAIARVSGLKNLSWDGYMKNCMRRLDQERMRSTVQEQYVNSVRQRLTPISNPSSSVGPMDLNIS